MENPYQFLFEVMYFMLITFCNDVSVAESGTLITQSTVQGRECGCGDRRTSVPGSSHTSHHDSPINQISLITDIVRPADNKLEVYDTIVLFNKRYSYSNDTRLDYKLQPLNLLSL